VARKSMACAEAYAVRPHK